MITIQSSIVIVKYITSDAVDETVTNDKLPPPSVFIKSTAEPQPLGNTNEKLVPIEVGAISVTLYKLLASRKLIPVIALATDFIKTSSLKYGVFYYLRNPFQFSLISVFVDP